MYTDDEGVTSRSDQSAGEKETRRVCFGKDKGYLFSGTKVLIMITVGVEQKISLRIKKFVRLALRMCNNVILSLERVLRSLA